MKLCSLAIYFILVIFACFSILDASINGGETRLKQQDPIIERSDFPSAFMFGVATSAYQVIL